MNIEVEINGKEVFSNGYFAYDDCHKIYVLEDDEDMKQAKEYGYDIYPIEKIRAKYRTSCDLRFIYNWKLNKQYVCQFEKASFDIC